MTYLIFQSALSIENNQIKSWAPKRNPKTNNKKYWWENVGKIKKGDIIYFISDAYLCAKGRAIMDGKEVVHQDYYTEPHNNDSWSDDGYGVISEVLEIYQTKQIKIIQEMKQKNYQIEAQEKDRFPFCIRTGSFTAKQGGYCFEIHSKLITFIEECVINAGNRIKWGEKYNHHNILDKKLPSTYGTSEISSKKIKKGEKGEKGTQKFFENKGFLTELVAEEKRNPADLVIRNNGKEYMIEIKNITVESAEKSIYLNDSQLQSLYLQKTYLCLYYGLEEMVFLLNPQKQKTVIKELIESFDKIRENVIHQYSGKFYVDNISVLVTEKMIVENFIDISNWNLNQIEAYLNKK